MSNISTTIPPGYARLLSVLIPGKENAKTSEDIVLAMGWSQHDKRQVFHIIEVLIKKYGCLIGSSRKGENKGYYLIETHEEYVETMQTYNAQIQSMLDRHRKLQENYERFPPPRKMV